MKEIFAQNEAILSRVKMGHTSLFPETAFSLPLFGESIYRYNFTFCECTLHFFTSVKW
jgi:hypothetical protein